jgi:hypothetical protein
MKIDKEGQILISIVHGLNDFVNLLRATSIDQRLNNFSKSERVSEGQKTRQEPCYCQTKEKKGDRVLLAELLHDLVELGRVADDGAP